MKFLIGAALIAAGLSSAAVAADEEKKVTDRRAPNYVRCVSTGETGSLVRKRKTCHTNADWNKIENAQQGEADDLVSRTRGAITTNGGG